MMDFLQLYWGNGKNAHNCYSLQLGKGSREIF